METQQIDLLAVLLAAVMGLLIGFVWFSPWLFGNTWKKLSGMEKTKRNQLAPLWSFLAILIMAYILSFFELMLGVTTVSDGMFVGFLVWLGFVATTQISKVIWGKASFKLFLIDSTYRLLALLSMGGILGA